MMPYHGGFLIWLNLKWLIKRAVDICRGIISQVLLISIFFAIVLFLSNFMRVCAIWSRQIYDFENEKRFIYFTSNFLCIKTFFFYWYVMREEIFSFLSLWFFFLSLPTRVKNSSCNLYCERVFLEVIFNFFGDLEHENCVF